ncbi:DUF2934 domain-containing protein [Sinorhizobium meliloti]|uniref:DUF2934 domain-containing protein n=1 Tax=Rhizobium meliloti TaxID=382 RepID=UPI0031F5D6A6
MLTAAEEREERIRQRAYEVWEKDGKRHGDHERHWQQAADEIDKETSMGSAGGESGLASDLQPGQVQPGGGPGHGAASVGNVGNMEARSSGRSGSAATA